MLVTVPYDEAIMRVVETMQLWRRGVATVDQAAALRRHLAERAAALPPGFDPRPGQTTARTRDPAHPHTQAAAVAGVFRCLPPAPALRDPLSSAPAPVSPPTLPHCAFPGVPAPAAPAPTSPACVPACRLWPAAGIRVAVSSAMEPAIVGVVQCIIRRLLPPAPFALSPAGAVEPLQPGAWSLWDINTYFWRGSLQAPALALTAHVRTRRIAPGAPYVFEWRRRQPPEDEIETPLNVGRLMSTTRWTAELDVSAGPDPAARPHAQPPQAPPHTPPLPAARSAAQGAYALRAAVAELGGGAPITTRRAGGRTPFYATRQDAADPCDGLTCRLAGLYLGAELRRPQPLAPLVMSGLYLGSYQQQQQTALSLPLFPPDAVAGACAVPAFGRGRLLAVRGVWLTRVLLVPYNRNVAFSAAVHTVQWSDAMRSLFSFTGQMLLARLPPPMPHRPPQDSCALVCHVTRRAALPSALVVVRGAAALARRSPTGRSHVGGAVETVKLFSMEHAVSGRDGRPRVLWARHSPRPQGGPRAAAAAGGRAGAGHGGTAAAAAGTSQWALRAAQHEQAAAAALSRGRQHYLLSCVASSRVRPGRAAVCCSRFTAVPRCMDERGRPFAEAYGADAGAAAAAATPHALHAAVGVWTLDELVAAATAAPTDNDTALALAIEREERARSHAAAAAGAGAGAGAGVAGADASAAAASPLAPQWAEAESRVAVALERVTLHPLTIDLDDATAKKLADLMRTAPDGRPLTLIDVGGWLLPHPVGRPPEGTAAVSTPAGAAAGGAGAGVGAAGTGTGTGLFAGAGDGANSSGGGGAGRTTLYKYVRFERLHARLTYTSPRVWITGWEVVLDGDTQRGVSSVGDIVKRYSYRTKLSVGKYMLNLQASKVKRLRNMRLRNNRELKAYAAEMGITVDEMRPGGLLARQRQQQQQQGSRMQEEDEEEDDDWGDGWELPGESDVYVYAPGGAGGGAGGDRSGQALARGGGTGGSGALSPAHQPAGSGGGGSGAAGAGASGSVAGEYLEDLIGIAKWQRVQGWTKVLEQRPDLIKCLAEAAPSWGVDANNPSAAGKLAGKIAGMFNVLSCGIHPFIPGVGLVVYTGVLDAPTCEGLVCLAEALGVPCERHRVSGGRQLCVPFALSGRAAFRCAWGGAEGCGVKLARGKAPGGWRQRGHNHECPLRGRHDSAVGGSWDGRDP
eukprot:XP_001703563.1 predicted protein [Chlamydomonas reinhardtii]